MATSIKRTNRGPMNFSVMQHADIPQGRKGKHRGIVSQILSDLDRVQTGAALKVPLKQLSDTKAKIRAALNRASRKAGRRVATASDDDFLYIWNETPQAMSRK